MPTAAYDQMADWYERSSSAASRRGRRPLGIDQALRGLLGYGSGICLEIGCGTGVRAATIRELGQAGENDPHPLVETSSSGRGCSTPVSLIS